MRQSNRGSILLYVLFLSSFLILFFASFQSEVEKTLERAQDSESDAVQMSSIQDALVSLKNAPSAIRTVSADDRISLVSLDQTGNVFLGSLGGYDPKEYWITSTGWSTFVNLSIISWWPVSYRLAAFNSGSEASSVLLSSGVIAASVAISLSSMFDQHVLVVDPLGGAVQYSLDPGVATLIPASSQYRLERDINGYKKDEGVYEVVNFAPKSRSNFDYQKMGMYLK